MCHPSPAALGNLETQAEGRGEERPVCRSDFLLLLETSIENLLRAFGGEGGLPAEVAPLWRGDIASRALCGVQGVGTSHFKNQEEVFIHTVFKVPVSTIGVSNCQ